MASLFLPGPLRLGPRLDRALDYTSGWVVVACLGLASVIYLSTRTKHDYVTKIIFPSNANPLTLFHVVQDTIPAIGRKGFIASYLDAIRSMTHCNEFLMEGYAKYQPGIFRISELSRWHVIVSGPQLTDELHKAPEDVLSFDAVINDRLASDWTIGPEIQADPYHIPIVKSQLTRNLGNFFSDLHEEIVLAFNENIPQTEEWTKVRALDTMMTIVSRATNRIFVGARTCRNAEYTALNVRYTVDVIIASKIITIFPKFLKPLAGRLFTRIPQSLRVALKHLGPIIEERKQKIEAHGRNYPEKPMDMLSWLMDEAQGEERSNEKLTLRILNLNFAAIHTSSMTFTAVLYELACRPEYMVPIREEVEAAVAEHGWTRVALNRMRKLESFMKETQRTQGLGGVSLMRKALKEFTFSDGTCLPKGTHVSAVATPRQLDSTVYPDGLTFKGFRFSDMWEQDEGIRHRMISTSVDFLAFGHGKHACPGRFFAVNQLKAMMAHVVLTYDLMMIKAPKSTWFETSKVPDRNAEVLFRKRRV